MSAKTRPNIVFISTDQQHVETLSAYGCSHLQTPAMDELARMGTSYMRSYTTHPVCLPARASWFTGRMPSETGVCDEGRELLPELPTLGDWLAKHGGYRCVYAGKWHVPKYIPSAHDDIPGFETVMTGISGQGFMMDTGVSMACEAFIRNYDDERPFLLSAAFMNPHDICEWQFLNSDNQDELRFPELGGALPELPDNMDPPVPEPDMIRGFRGNLDPHVDGWGETQWRYYLWSYYRHIEMLDAEIGRILGALKETGLLSNTLILLTSDHGEGLGHHQMTHKLFPYDEVTRVPFILAWPGCIPAERIDRENLASGLDIFPTLCDYAGVETPASMRGVSLRPTMEAGEPFERPFVPVEWHGNRGQVIRSARWKYSAYKGDRVEQLFDMNNDPGETENLAQKPEYNAVLRDHRGMLANWMSSLELSPGLPKDQRWSTEEVLRS